MRRLMIVLAAAGLWVCSAGAGEKPLSNKEGRRLAREEPALTVNATGIPDRSSSGSGYGAGSIETPRERVYFVEQHVTRKRRRSVKLKLAFDPARRRAPTVPGDPEKVAREWATSLPLEAELKLDKRQIKKAARIAAGNVKKLKAYLRDMDAFMQALDNCRRAPGDPQAARQLCVLLPKVRHEPQITHGLEAVLVPEQRRCLTRKRLQSPVPTSTAWGEEIKFRGRVNGTLISEGRYQVQFAARAGKWTCRIFFVGRAEQLLKRIRKFSDSKLGEELTCNVDRRLRRKAISGTLEFSSMKQGLEQLAKLVGGTLRKDGDTWLIAPAKAKKAAAGSVL
jgi:hypothetical protein